MTRIDDPQAAIEKKLDEVVGGEYDPVAKGLAGKVRAGIVRWIVAALLALAMVAVIVATIESHRLPPGGAKVQPKPVPVQILPARSGKAALRDDRIDPAGELGAREEVLPHRLTRHGRGIELAYPEPHTGEIAAATQESVVKVADVL